MTTEIDSSSDDLTMDAIRTALNKLSHHPQLTPEQAAYVAATREKPMPEPREPLFHTPRNRHERRMARHQQKAGKRR